VVAQPAGGVSARTGAEHPRLGLDEQADGAVGAFGQD
jgi:hypothetical protein